MRIDHQLFGISSSSSSGFGRVTRDADVSRRHLLPCHLHGRVLLKEDVRNRAMGNEQTTQSVRLHEVGTCELEST